MGHFFVAIVTMCAMLKISPKHKYWQKIDHNFGQNHDTIIIFVSKPMLSHMTDTMKMLRMFFIGCQATKIQDGGHFHLEILVSLTVLQYVKF